MDVSWIIMRGFFVRTPYIHLQKKVTGCNRNLGDSRLCYCDVRKEIVLMRTMEGNLQAESAQSGETGLSMVLT